jgi:hypothetical protein
VRPNFFGAPRLVRLCFCYRLASPPFGEGVFTDWAPDLQGLFFGKDDIFLKASKTRGSRALERGATRKTPPAPAVLQEVF